MTFALSKAKVEFGNPDSLIGAAESLWLEAKSVLYDLNKPEDRYELAKDVSAFANAEGGFLLIGFEEDQTDVTRPVPIIASLAPFPLTAFPVQKYLGMLDHYIHPELEGLRVYWKPDGEASKTGVGIIEVPPQAVERKYFLISNVVEENRPIKEIVVGLVQRRDTDNIPMDRNQLYQLMQQGKHELPTLLRQIDGKIDAVLNQLPAKPSQHQLARDRIIERLRRSTE
jgi:predicted HTH transcriptional regulator